jgi:hypothetical protein
VIHAERRDFFVNESKKGLQEQEKGAKGQIFDEFLGNSGPKACFSGV